MQRIPLAEKIRPTTFDEMVGQKHLFGEKGSIRRLLSSEHIPNMIFYGPPGTGKTTAAQIIAGMSGMSIKKLNATTATLNDIRDVIAETDSFIGADGVLLYLDEIQYFNKKQQQSLLQFLEDGRITLIASTTENPKLYVYNAILSRSAVFEFKEVTPEDMIPALERALGIICKETGVSKTADGDVIEYIAKLGAGDVRRAVNLLEHSFFAADDIIKTEHVDSLTFDRIGNFDKSGTVHYDMLSCLQKSIRGSDPDAAAFYLAHILEGGDLIGACRRLQVIACEDVGLAYPSVIPIVRACVEMAKDLGMPEARIPLVDAAVLLATAPKSNSAYLAYDMAKTDLEAGKGRTVPAPLRPSNDFAGYKYPHDYPDHYVKQQYLPDDIKDRKYYEFGSNKTEQTAKAYWDKIKGNNK